MIESLDLYTVGEASLELPSQHDADQRSSDEKLLLKVVAVALSSAIVSQNLASNRTCFFCFFFVLVR